MNFNKMNFKKIIDTLAMMLLLLWVFVGITQKSYLTLFAAVSIFIYGIFKISKADRYNMDK